MRCKYVKEYRSKCHREALPDSERGYCILHEDWDHKTEEETRKEFYREIEEGITDFEGCILPEVGLSGKEFEGGLNFSDAKIKRYAWFNWTTIKGDVDFFQATIEGFERGFWEPDWEAISFWGARIDGDASFTRATIKGGAPFNGATVKGDVSFKGATIKGYASFVGARIKGCVSFWVARIDRGVFCSGATIKDYVSLDGARIKGDAFFVGARIEGDASFIEATIKGQAFFDGATIKGNVRFLLSNISYLSFKNLNFSDYRHYVALCNKSSLQSNNYLLNRS
jgi:uncharacterized protein YjbI with pentapeptide repeats